jgi:hypothetical protein
MSETVFMVMPFGDEIALSAYRHSTRPIVESFGFRIQRADEIFSANPIFDDIVTAIEQSSIVVIDISNRNANCCYELGVAHTLKGTSKNAPLRASLTALLERWAERPEHHVSESACWPGFRAQGLSFSLIRPPAADWRP